MREKLWYQINVLRKGLDITKLSRPNVYNSNILRGYRVIELGNTIPESGVLSGSENREIAKRLIDSTRNLAIRLARKSGKLPLILRAQTFSLGPLPVRADYI